MQKNNEVKFNTIEEAIEEIRKGNMIIVVDDEDRENEGDLVMAAEKVTPQTINFMAKHARGLICVPMVESRLKRLGINSMVKENSDILNKVEDQSDPLIVDGHAEYAAFPSRSAVPGWP